MYLSGFRNETCRFRFSLVPEVCMITIQVVAAINTRIAAWSLSGVQQDAWRIHSTLVLPENHIVTALDNKAGLLAVGTGRGLSVYTLVLENDLPTWSQKWAASVPAVTLASFAPSLMYIATVSNTDNSVRLFSTTSGRRTQVLPHPRPVVKVAWRRSQASSRDDLILYTITSDSTLRIFLPVLDSPEHLQLHASLDVFSSSPLSISSNQLALGASTVFWLDRRIVGTVLSRILETNGAQDDVRITRIREISDEGWDLFFRVLGDGSVVITAVSNIDRRPPTLLGQFTLHQAQPGVFSCPPSYLYVLPNPDLNLLTLVTLPPLMSIDFSPLLFFGAQSQALHISSKAVERIPAEESEILRLVRTPEGKGVGVLRKNGGGEAWRITERGSKLVRSVRWNDADFMVPLEHGCQIVTYSKADGLLTLHSSPPQILTLPTLESLFTLPSPSGHEYIIGITTELSIIQIHAPTGSDLTIRSLDKLPLPYLPKLILPVDPMAWRLTHAWAEHDVLLSVSEQGELAFWVPEATGESRWRCTATVKTGRTGFKKARCSSMKKTALVVEGSDGDELTIWDSTESEFASGLEYIGIHSEPILDLDWSSTPDMQSILAVGYLRHVNLLCQQRMTYFDEDPGWALCRKIEIQSFTPYPISDSIWLAHGSFLVAAGQQMFLFSEPPQPEPEAESLFEFVARQNGPLEDYHPQMLLQCLLWEKVELVKEIVVNLAHDVENRGNNPAYKWTSLSVDKFFQTDRAASEYVAKKRYSMLFSEPNPKEDEEKEGFSRPLVTRLIEALETNPLPRLTVNEQAHLSVLIQTTLEIDEQRRALDSNGLRYLISMRSFYILNRRVSSSSPPTAGSIPLQTGRRERLRYRDMIWAFHSESQELLLASSTDACNKKMTWTDARSLGVALWLNSPEALRSQFEVIARNEYMAGDARDPTACSLYYFALGKPKLVQGLWRQAAWHKEQTIMLKFLSNDFTEPRWRTAALKNGYALLSKRRFEYAAAFFLLGNALKDAVNICIKQLGDFQLAVALARVVEQANDGPILFDVLTNTVLPIALQQGNRWLGSWAFWLLHRRDLAVRILLTPLQNIATAYNIIVTEIKEPHYDDPSLALLFSQLRSKTLQAAKGTSEISGRAEFNFVLQMSRVFCRMGCHALALDLVRSWSFVRPSTASRKPRISKTAAPVPRPLFPLEPALRRRSSIIIDMDVISLPPTRSASPVQDTEKPLVMEPIQEESDLFARKAGLGDLMKSAKQDVKVPEFDINAFF